ncbi:MAG: RDD family protein [Bryobacteraceae bacterium]
MLELQGMELASFTSRACALGVDFLVATALFMSAGMGVGTIATSLGFKGNVHIELNFFENWYSIVYLVLFFGLSVYIGNGKTLGKRLFHIQELGFGFLQYFIHPNRRTVHDRIAETIVVCDIAPPSPARSRP